MPKWTRFLSLARPARPEHVPAWLSLLSKLGITVVVTWFVVRAVGVGLDDLATLEADWWSPDWALAAVGTLVLVTGYMISAVFWGLLVRDLGGRSLRPLTALRVFLTANLARYVPGKVWQIAGLALLAGREGVTPVVAGTAAVLGQGAALGGATLLGAGALLVAEGPLRSWGWVALALVGVLTLVSATPTGARRLAGAWFRLAGMEGAERVNIGRTFGIRWIVLYFINWIVYATAFVILAMGYGVETEPFRVGAAFAAAYVIGYVAVFAPAGIGVRESFLVVFLSPITGPAQAGGLAIVARVWTTVVEVATALAVQAAGKSEPRGAGTTP